MDGGVLASVCAIVDGQAHCSFTGAPDGASDEDAGSEEREDGERPRPPFTLRPVPLATRLLEVEVGAGFACGRRESGEVLCWGSNFDGVLAPHRSAEPAVIPLP
jgi:hypothetical protein